MTQKQDRWILGHTHISTIETFHSFDNYNRQDKNRTYPVSPWMLLQHHPKHFPEGDREWKLPYMDRPQQ